MDVLARAKQNGAELGQKYGDTGNLIDTGSLLLGFINNNIGKYNENLKKLQLEMIRSVKDECKNIQLLTQAREALLKNGFPESLINQGLGIIEE